MRVRLKGLALLAVVSGLLAGSTTAKNALSASVAQADRVSREVLSATGSSDLVSPSGASHDADSAAFVRTPGGTVDIPQDPSAGIVVTTSTGSLIRIGIARAQTSERARTTASGTVVFADAHSTAATAVQATRDGLREVFTLRDASSPSDFAMPITLPVGGRMVPTETGGYDIVVPATAATAISTGSIEQPWAVDAVGKSLPTSFSWDGQRLTQHVNTAGAVFPVVADPHYTWGWVTGTIYFNRRETANLRNRFAVIAAAWAVVGGFGAIPPAMPYAAAFATWMSAQSGAIASVASNAYGDGRCMKLKIYGPAGVPQTYSGGYCR
jgi:hypothetical protein